MMNISDEVRYCPWCGSRLRNGTEVCEKCDRHIEDFNNPVQVELDENIFIKFSFSTPEITEEYLSTIYRMERFYCTENGRTVMQFRYYDVYNDPETGERLGVIKTEETADDNITEMLELYMPTENVKTFKEILETALSSNELNIQLEKLDMGIHLPPHETETHYDPEEYLQLQLEHLGKNGDLITLQFFNHSTIKREKDILPAIRSIASDKNIQLVQKEVSSIVSELLEITPSNPDPILLANTPEEMVRKMIGIKDLGNGWVEEPVEEKMKIQIISKNVSSIVNVLNQVFPDI